MLYFKIFCTYCCIYLLLHLFPLAKIMKIIVVTEIQINSIGDAVKRNRWSNFGVWMVKSFSYMCSNLGEHIQNTLNNDIFIIIKRIIFNYIYINIYISYIMFHNFPVHVIIPVQVKILKITI